MNCARPIHQTTVETFSRENSRPEKPSGLGRRPDEGERPPVMAVPNSELAKTFSQENPGKLS
jgi:hypothetical protein